jgi:prevent-host-death family protein
MERQIGATDLRQKLTDIIQEIREERVAYVIETFGRPQAVLINIDEYRQYEQYRREREAFFNWLEETSMANAARNQGLSESDLLALIDAARKQSSGVE